MSDLVMTFSMQDVKNDLERWGRNYAIPLAEAIEARAKTDHKFSEILDRWLQEGGTVRLRDDLCRPFVDADFIKSMTDRRYPWHDSWAALDTARLHLRLKEQGDFQS